jgi:hypothetical protein
MAYHYSSESRESRNALPDLEVFYAAEGELESRDQDAEPGETLPAGWYYWYCFPGCLPDSEPNGPFETEDLALADAREGTDDDR